MRIAMIHEAIIPPPLYGGTERVVAWLCEELIALGHSVTLFAREGSSVEGANFLPFQEWQAHAHQYDLLHFWATPHPEPTFPYLVTIEGNGQPQERFHPNTVFVSKRHAENHQSSRSVYNGLKLPLFACDEKREDYLVFLAKASWNVKNLEGAIRIAKAAQLPLHVLGSRSYPLHLERWLNPIRSIHYFGMVDDREKKEHLRKARALLFPVRWEEPFGIALTEALASGCPVLGTPYGSLPEIVAPEVGVLSTSGDELVRALKYPLPSPKQCRTHVETHFSSRKMALDYLALYEEVLEKKTLGPAPSTRPGFDAKALLPWNHPGLV